MTSVSGKPAVPPRRATMRDVADLADVSVKTVSRVVNAEAGVHTETAERVLAAIDQLGFRRNLGARNLRRGASSGTVGLVLEDLGNPFYSQLTRAVEEVARHHGRQVLSGSSDEDPDRERSLALEFCAHRVDGLLVVPAGRSHSYLVPELHAGIPMVFLDRPASGLAADSVLVDNDGGMRSAVGHLADYGHRCIAFIGDAPEVYTAGRRLHGFRQGCAEHGVPYHENNVILARPGPEALRQSLARVLEPPNPATAVIAGNNRITVQLLRLLTGAPYRPAILGFDDFELADMLQPRVSVIAHDVGQMGRLAAELLFARLDGDERPVSTLTVPTQVISRGSAEVKPRIPARIRT